MNKTDLSRFDNSWYSPGAGSLKCILWYFTNALFFTSRLLPISALKVSLLRIFGAKVGLNVVIKPAVNIKYPWRLTIGNNVWIGENAWIDNLDNVIIADNVCISQGAMLLCGNHNYKVPSFDLMTGPITLEEGAWVGAQSVVCPGVTIGSHAVLTVGSVASSDLAPYSICQGNPATKVKDRIIN